MGRRSFTLIEVLTVIAIIGILASLGAYTYAATLTRSRDSQRIADLQFIRNGLEQFYLDHRTFPQFEGNGELPQASWQLESGYNCQTKPLSQFLAPKYLAQIPQDPSAKFTDPSSGCNAEARGQYLYFGIPKDSSKVGYYLLARMERLQNINYSTNAVDLADYFELSLNFCDSGQFQANPTGCSQNAFVTNSKNN